MTARRIAHLVDQTLEASVVGSFTRVGPALRRRLLHWEPNSSAGNLQIVITGATSGLGLEAAEHFVRLGASVHLVGRNAEKLDGVVDHLCSRELAHGQQVCGYVADLSLMTSAQHLVRELTHAVPVIDVLIHNAGALLRHYTETVEGIEQTLAVHVLAPDLLTRGLAPSLAKGRGQVITMTSGGLYSERFDLAALAMTKANYNGTTAYARAKRAQTLLTRGWNEQFHKLGIRADLVHPGWAKTPGVAESLPVFAAVMGPLLRTPSDGVDTLVWLATTDASVDNPGQLWLDRQPRGMHKLHRTQLSEADERASVEELRVFCQEQIARGLTTGHSGRDDAGGDPEVPHAT
jgi:NAD(P)-dependent dehydrogenase (short-subunit alcohol dehydrogenase family)